MHRQVICTLSLMAMIGVKPSLARGELLQYVPDAQIVGQARMSVMFWDIYDAALLAPERKWSAEKPFALKLTYLRHLHGQKIADRAVKEMREQGFVDEVKLATWHTQMLKIFPDVYKGDTITGIFTKDGEVIFLNDNQEIGRIKDAKFSKHFSDIWLSPKTSAPEERLSLLGLNMQKGQDSHETIERMGSYGTSHMH